MIFTSALLLDWAFQGLERMELVALGETLRAAGFLALVLIGLHHRSQIFRLPLFTVLSQLFPVALLMGIFRWKFHGIRPTFDWSAWKDEPSRLGEIVRVLGRVLVLMALPMVVAGWVFAPQVLSLVFGRAFLPAASSFRILLGYLLLAHIYCPFYYLLPACGKEKAF